MARRFDIHQLDVVIADSGFRIGVSRLGRAVLGVLGGAEYDIRGEVYSLGVARSSTVTGFTVRGEGVELDVDVRSAETPGALYGRVLTARYRNIDLGSGVCTYDSRTVSANKNKEGGKDWDVSVSTADDRTNAGNVWVNNASKSAGNVLTYLNERLPSRAVIIDPSIKHEARTMQFASTTATAEKRTVEDVYSDVEDMLRCTVYVLDDGTLFLTRAGGSTLELYDYRDPGYRRATLTRSAEFYNSVTVTPVGWDKPADSVVVDTETGEGETTATPDITYDRTISTGTTEKRHTATIACPWDVRHLQVWAAAQPLALGSDEFVSSVDAVFDESVISTDIPRECAVWLGGRRYGPFPITGYSVSVDTTQFDTALTLGPEWLLWRGAENIDSDPHVVITSAGATTDVYTTPGHNVTRWIGRYTPAATGQWAAHHQDKTEMPVASEGPYRFTVPSSVPYNCTLWGVDSGGVPVTPPYTFILYGGEIIG